MRALQQHEAQGEQTAEATKDLLPTGRRKQHMITLDLSVISRSSKPTPAGQHRLESGAREKAQVIDAPPRQGQKAVAARLRVRKSE